MSAQEGPACVPLECQNNKDAKILSTGMQSMMEAFVQNVVKGTRAEEKLKDVRVNVEIDCSMHGGPEKGAGGDRKITVDDDYVSDAQPLPRSARVPGTHRTYKS